MLAAALWWGSLTTIGFLVVPLLFQHADSARQAGQLAARMFAAGTWVSVGCGMLLLVAARTEDDEPRMDWAQGAMVFVVLGMLLALLAEFAVAPRIVARQNLPVWHGMGTALYAAQWLCALIVLWKLSAIRHAAEGGSPGSPPPLG